MPVSNASPQYGHCTARQLSIPLVYQSPRDRRQMGQTSLGICDGEVAGIDEVIETPDGAGGAPIGEATSPLPGHGNCLRAVVECGAGAGGDGWCVIEYAVPHTQALVSVDRRVVGGVGAGCIHRVAKGVHVDVVAAEAVHAVLHTG